jgi:3-deoxy-D-manno-octulosonic-acid transferase
MRFLYDIFFIIFSIIYLPYFLLKGKYHKEFLQRFGIFNKDIFKEIATSRPIWLHAVSVGEMKTAESLITKMRAIFPSKRFVISNITQTGHNIAVSVAREKDVVIYFPMDLSFIVKKLVRLINPAIFIAIETEIWPNLITELAVKNIPVILANGRISPKSFRNYHIIKPVMRNILRKTTLFCMRTAADAERIMGLGAPADRVNVTGNMKFDSVFIKNEKESLEWPPIKNRCAWLSKSSKLIIAGSTHRGEDGKILKSYKILKKDFPNLSLLIAPRHIERTEEINTLIEKAGFHTVRISEIEERCVNFTSEETVTADDNSVFVLDSIGRLGSLYKLAYLVFMGGSLVPHGGHNFIEPAAYAKPIVTGSHVHNFKDLCSLFLSNRAVEVVNNDKELVYSFERLLSDEKKSEDMGQRAKQVVSENIGSTDRNIALIKQFL